MPLESSISKEVEEFRDGTEKVQRQFEEAGARLKTQAMSAWDDLADVIRHHPGKALSIALATGASAGILVASLSRRRTATASDKLRDLAYTGTDAWERLRGGFNEAMGTLKEAVDEAVAKFK